jgi:hypothetical protein
MLAFFHCSGLSPFAQANDHHNVMGQYMSILHIPTWIQTEIIMEEIQDCVKAVQQEH